MSLPRVTDDDLRRAVVNPAVTHYRSAMEAAAVMRQIGYADATAEDILVAIYSGEVYCGRHWDFKWPLGHVPEAEKSQRGAASWVNLAAMRAAHRRGLAYE
jgi:hypothetical protein